MTVFRTLLAVLIAASFVGAPALADPPRARGADRADSLRGRGTDRADPPRTREADRAFRNTQQGRSLPLPQLERKVMPFMGGADYLGPELTGGSYRLKFMENGRVIWVDVDAQTGRIIRRSRP